VRRQSQLFDIVVTSGGVGPTHDDVTIKSVAEAFGQRMEVNPRMLRTLVQKVTAECPWRARRRRLPTKLTYYLLK
jgi:FAD synthetase